MLRAGVLQSVGPSARRRLQPFTRGRAMYSFCDQSACGHAAARLIGSSRRCRALKTGRTREGREGGGGEGEKERVSARSACGRVCARAVGPASARAWAAAKWGRDARARGAGRGSPGQPRGGARAPRGHRGGGLGLGRRGVARGRVRTDVVDDGALERLELREVRVWDGRGETLGTRGGGKGSARGRGSGLGRGARGEGLRRPPGRGACGRTLRTVS